MVIAHLESCILLASPYLDINTFKALKVLLL